MANHRSFKYGHITENIYLDTSFLLLAAAGRQDEHAECAVFIRRLLDKSVDDRIDQLVDLFDAKRILHLIDISTEDTTNALRCMREYGLDSYDASHAGAMVSYDLIDIATNDRDFDTVDYFNLWLPNDLLDTLRGFT